MNLCERFETSLSAMIDGELETVELLPVADHLARCAACRRFYRDARALDALVLEASNAAPVELPLGAGRDLWKRIEAAGKLDPAAASTAMSSARWKVWGSVAAATLLVSVGLSAFSLWTARRVQPVEDRPVVVVLGQEDGRMSDERFVELATELLRADPTYHQRMVEVMNLVTRRSVANEGTMEQRTGEERNRRETSGAARDETIEAAVRQGRS